MRGTKWHDLAQIMVRGRFRSYDTGAPLQHRWGIYSAEQRTTLIARSLFRFQITDLNWISFHGDLVLFSDDRRAIMKRATSRRSRAACRRRLGHAPACRRRESLSAMSIAATVPIARCLGVP